MSVTPLITSGERRTVVSTREDFDAAGGFGGHVSLIVGIDGKQLSGTEGDSNASDDLRIGREYKNHRDQQKEELLAEGKITLLPGNAVIIETEETVCLPRSLFGYIVPKVSLLQKGISNTVSKVDPGYDGPLVVTLFNLGRKTVVLGRGDKFCSLVIHSVGDGALLYSKPAQRITGEVRRGQLRRVLDSITAYGAIWSVAAVAVGTLVLLVELIPKLLSVVSRFWSR